MTILENITLSSGGLIMNNRTEVQNVTVHVPTVPCKYQTVGLEQDYCISNELALEIQ